MEARVTAYSQAHRLRERMAQAEVQHGQEIRADLPGIGVTTIARDWFTAGHTGKGQVFFCTMGPIRVRKVTIPGDGGPLPTNGIVEAWRSLVGGPTTCSTFWSGQMGTCGSSWTTRRGWYP